MERKSNGSKDAGVTTKPATPSGAPSPASAPTASPVPNVHGQTSVRALLQRLSDKTYKKRRAAVVEIQQMVLEMVLNGRADSVPYVVSEVHSRLICNTNVNARKGGLMALGAVGIALADSNSPGLLSQYVERLLSIVLVSFSDPDSSVRYAASEALYNIGRVARPLLLPYMDRIFDVLSRVVADTDEKSQQGAGLLDRLFKDIVSEMDADINVEPFVKLVAQRMYVLDPHSRRFLVSWVVALQAVPGVSFVAYLPKILDGLFRVFSDPDPELQSMCEELLNEFLVEMAIGKQFDGVAMLPTLLKYAKQEECFHTRRMALSWIAEIAGLDLDSTMRFAPRIAAVVLPALSASSDTIRETSVSINQAMRKFPFELHEATSAASTSLTSASSSPPEPADGSVAAAEAGGNKDETVTLPQQLQTFDLAGLLIVLSSQVKRGSAATRLAVLRWILRLHRSMPIRLYQYNEELSLVLLRTACDPDDTIARLALECVAETASCPEGQDVPAVQRGLAKRSLKHFLKRLLVMLGDHKGAALRTRLSFIVVNLATYLGPELLWNELVRAQLEDDHTVGSDDGGGGGVVRVRDHWYACPCYRRRCTRRTMLMTAFRPESLRQCGQTMNLCENVHHCRQRHRNLLHVVHLDRHHDH
eukprot:m.36005 g.36005  ORF g.36005 m.36005 type:complete len:645 (+) comp5350_c0_seq1:187-2121(+)